MYIKKVKKPKEDKPQTKIQIAAHKKKIKRNIRILKVAKGLGRDKVTFMVKHLNKEPINAREFEKALDEADAIKGYKNNKTVKEENESNRLSETKLRDIKTKSESSKSKK